MLSSFENAIPVISRSIWRERFLFLESEVDWLLTDSGRTRTFWIPELENPIPVTSILWDNFSSLESVLDKLNG